VFASLLDVRPAVDAVDGRRDVPGSISSQQTKSVKGASWGGEYRRRSSSRRGRAELLGHSDVRTTMIYTHTVRSVTIKEARSPLDFPSPKKDPKG
jgi:integrase